MKKKKQPSIDYAYLGKRLNQRRKELKLTQTEIAQAMDCEESFVSRVENGKALPSLELLYRMAKMLGVGLDYFFQDTVSGEVYLKNNVNEKLATCSPQILVLLDAIIDDIIEYTKSTDVADK